MKGKDLIKLGFRPGPAVGVALKLVPKAQAALGAEEAKRVLQALAADPASHVDDPHFGEVARALVAETERPSFTPRETPAPYRIWGEGLEPNAVQQLENAVRLPVSVAGALMPDAHVGYGLPIGGVLATENAVIPYGVGVDIACRMKLSVYDVPAEEMKRLNDRLVNILRRETIFGAGAGYKKPVEHPVLEEDWNVTPVTRHVFPKARTQLGTSGSGNHFVEWGVFTLGKPDLGLEPGRYLALLSHSGSRGAGAMIANHYSRLAMDLHPELPPELRRLAWLDLDSEAGQEYWAAMNLMGHYAAANHAVIHRKVHKALGAELIAGVENHHNFCIPAAERIPTPDGPVTIQELQPGREVYSLDSERGLVPARVKAVWMSGHQRIYTVNTAHRRIRVSGNHPILALKDGYSWVIAADLRAGDQMVCARGYYRSDCALPPGQARFIGAFLGDGWIRKRPERQGYGFGLAIGNASESHTDRYAQLMTTLETPPVAKKTWKNAPLRLKVGASGAYGISDSNRALYQLIRDLGIGMESTQRRVPLCVFAAPRTDKLAFLAGYMDADGSMGSSRRRDASGLVRACSEGLVADLREVAISAGLQCTNLRRRRVSTNYGTVDCFSFNISPSAMKKLDLWHEARRAVVERANVCETKLRQALHEGVFVEKITSIEVSEVAEPVWDLEVDHESHSFVCEGVVVHNCWREVHNGRELFVHRKGATPAGEGVLGVIPGSMATPCFIVRGKGSAPSLESASHGAGRVMSRTAAKDKFRWAQIRPVLEERGVQLLSAGIDENPFVYKDIEQVMAQQADLVEVVARFDPRIVRMCESGEPPED